MFRIPFLVRNRKYPLRRKTLLHFLPYQNRTLYLRRLLPRFLPPLHNFLFRRRLLIPRLLCRLYFLLSLLLRCLLRLRYLRRRRLVLLRRLLILRRRLLLLRIIRLLLLLRYPRFRLTILFHPLLNLILTPPLRIFILHLRLP